MKYLKSFNTESERQSYETGLDYTEPYVSIIKDSDKVYYNGGTEKGKRIATISSNPELMVILKEAGFIPSDRTNLYRADVKNLTDIQDTFRESSTLVHFDEFKYFTGLTEINDYTFLGCINLTSITIPKSITYIGQEAFSECIGLTSITIPNSVGIIDESAFSDCSGLTSINIPSSVTSIGNDAFSYCRGLTTIIIDSNTILSADYSSSSNLKDLFGSQVTRYIIGENVTSIGQEAFEDCNNMTSVVIPSSMTHIGQGSFDGCSGLTSFTCLATTPPTLGNYALESTNNCPIYVPSESVNTYKSAAGWSVVSSRIQAIV